ncbi:MAG: SdrD B-like domain-containing protein, partial [Ilumatobacteraceae bacterium]
MLAVSVGLVVVMQGRRPSTAHAAPTNTLKVNVTSARTEPRRPGGAVTAGQAIPTFKYIINVDNTGTTEQNPYKPASAANNGGCSVDAPGYPASCHWTSMGANSSAPIYTQGDQSDFTGAGLDLPDGRYLISVLADGFKLDGAHFTMPLADTTPLAVELQPTPLPTATIKAQVFADTSPTNSAPDLPIEHGLAGFTGQIRDYLGQVITDVFGNPICTHYTEEVGGFSPDYIIDQNLLVGPDYVPTPNPAHAGGNCYSDAAGVLTFPNLGPNRYTLTAIAPDGTNWVQTTTLEGNHDWDAWVMEGATGLDTEFTTGGEAFPAIFFGFVEPTTIATPGTGEIKGVVDGVHVYVPAKGGLGQTGQIFGGLTGTKIDKAIDKPWIALTALTGTPELDTAIYVGQGKSDGTFDIKNVPNGNYTITWWDEAQNYILDLVNVSVANGEVVDMGILPLNNWWSVIDGYVFNDDNRNGIKDPGEQGVPNYTLTMRKRENSLMDRGSTAVSTDATGYYKFESAYPMTQWLVEEAYNDSYFTTGVTYQGDNQPTPTTVVGAGVDVSQLPIIGLSGTLDWGVHAYDPTGANGIDPRNGGIVGTVSYDTTRNELDPRYAAVEDWQPGISDIPVGLFKPLACPVPNTTGVPCSTAAGPKYQLDTDGSYKKGAQVNAYLTETWEQPTGCVARDVDGNPLIHNVDEKVLTGLNAEGNDTPCLEGPLMGQQFQSGFSTVNGNYGFGTVCLAPNVLDATDPSAPTCTAPGDTTVPPTDQFTPIGAGDYLVAVQMPKDTLGRPLYKVTREEDINIGNGDQFVPQVPPPACVGALHTVDVAGAPTGSDGYPAVSPVPGVTVPASTPTDNATFVGIGGSPYEGQQKPLCETKLVSLKNGKSIVPTFNYFTDVALPGRFWGLLVDDLNFSSDPKSLLVGEKAGVPFAPVGVYDYTNKLVYTAESDYNGLWDVLMPSTNRINCPTPSGVCANLYRFVGNDPGAPGSLNLNYKPNFITIAAEFEALPGLIVPADLAPTQVGVNVQLPGGQFNQVQCAEDAAQPQIYRVDKPYGSSATGSTIVITGFGFGTAQGAGAVFLDGPVSGTTALPVTGWGNTQITVTVPAGSDVGARNLHITAANGMKTVNGLTYHVIGGAYNPTVLEVGPSVTNPRYDPTKPAGNIHALQHAIDD